MNQITLTKIIRDLKDDLNGLNWGLTGDTAFQVLTGSDTDIIDVTCVMDLEDYPEASLRLETDTDTRIDDNGVKVFELEKVYREVPILIRTTNFEDEMEVFQRIQYTVYNGIDVPVVPVEYLLATYVRQGQERKIKQLREQFDIDPDYLRTCVRVLGVESSLTGDQA